MADLLSKTDVQRQESLDRPVYGLNLTSRDLAQAAEVETVFQKDMTFVDAVWQYPRAVFFSMLMSICIIMEGYDTALLGNFYGIHQFNRKFGQPVNDGSGDWQLSSAWQSGLGTGTQVGSMAGLIIAGYAADKIGYVKTILAAQVLMVAFIFLQFFAQDVRMLFASYVLCGLPWGAFQALTTAYAADVTPLRLRPILTTFVNICWVIGQFINTGVLRGLISRPDEWAWRIPYAIQWAWPPIIVAGMLFAPESPAWLVKKDRVEDARGALRKLTNRLDDELEGHLALLLHTDEVERRLASLDKEVTYADCFKSSNFRRTEAACGAYMIQVLCGVWFGSNIVYFLQRGGMGEKQSFDFGLGTSALAFVGTLSTWWIMTKFGRRQMYLTGQSVMLLCLLIVGFIGIAKPSDAVNFSSAAFMMLFFLTFQVTVGPLAYAVVAELPTNRLRIKTVSLARVSYNLVAIGANFLNPPILNPMAWNLRGKGGFVWAGFNAIMLVWAYFRLPELAGRTTAELDILFDNRVSARKFATTDVVSFVNGGHIAPDEVKSVEPKV